MPLVAGVDSSTQSCKVVIRDADTGALVREGRAPHPDGTEVDPDALVGGASTAIAARPAGSTTSPRSSVGGAAARHGAASTTTAQVVRPALLWNDTRSAGAAADLVAELGAATRARAWAEAVGSVPVAVVHRDQAALARRARAATTAARTAAVCLPHDWLTWRLAGAHRPRRADAPTAATPAAPATGRRRPASTAATCSRSPSGATAVLPAGARPARARPGRTRSTARCSRPAPATTRRRARARRARRATSSCRSAPPASRVAVSAAPTADATGTVAGFADATGRFLPLVVHPQRGPGARRRGATARRRPRPSCAGSRCPRPPGADGLVLVPYLEGERTPEPARRHRRAARPDGWHDRDPGAPGPRRGRGHAVRARRRPRRAASRRASPVDRVLLIGGGAPLARRSAGSRRRCSAARCVVPDAGGVRRRRRGPPGGLGAARRRRAAGVGDVGQRRPSRPTPSRRSASATPRSATSRPPSPAEQGSLAGSTSGDPLRSPPTSGRGGSDTWLLSLHVLTEGYATTGWPTPSPWSGRAHGHDHRPRHGGGPIGICTRSSSSACIPTRSPRRGLSHHHPTTRSMRPSS